MMDVVWGSASIISHTVANVSSPGNGGMVNAGEVMVGNRGTDGVTGGRGWNVGRRSRESYSGWMAAFKRTAWYALSCFA